MEKSSSNNSTNKKRPSTIVQTDCKICGAPAKYSYFGVVSCNSCKMFFKRNAERGKEVLKCRYSDHCEINITNRHVCSHCRLIKCLNSGMRIELIRASFAKRNKQNPKEKSIKDSKQITSTALCRLNEPEQFRTLNLLQSDQSTLNTDQWNLISNLSHCYDEYSGLSIGERFMLEQNALPLKLRFKKEPIKALIQMALDKCQSLYKNNQDFTSLSTDDRSILLHATFKHVASLSSNFIIYKIQLMNYSVYFNVVEMITHPTALPVAKRLADRLDFDMIIMKLFLAILSFSTIHYTVYSNTPPVNLSNIKEIFRIQDTYIEIAWRYLLYKYDFERAVLCLSDLIRCVFVIDEGVVKTHNVQWLTDTISSIVTQTENTLTLN
ncbi:unnamed protein product [Rotaria sp. Silwood2]|nr:unnamed protein product [Rotaria sp. Silwood2]CAF2715779.1 unnamed protein product [Rotaria sp. Silwood2]CAF3916559.1 unnamed protein product [Rotaria sp. Silwood2]CAF3959680.1 unnamed protein product [Rotaria sp. Silwood2]CAF4158937.1 unnamed protein product [Rotaria sp. Silwood2]